METKPDLAAVRKAALARRDYVLWLANALENRANVAAGGKYGEMDAELDRTAAAELRSLVSHE
jgi:hypothetical protein